MDALTLGFWQVAAAYIFVLIVVLIFKFKNINKEKELLISVIRMTLQLILVGYILTFIFEEQNMIYTILSLAVMQTFAIHNIFQRVQCPLTPKMKGLIALSMTTGTLVSLFYFILVVVKVSPWYEPRYFIPLAGMMIGNAMTGITLGVDRLVEGMKSEQQRIEAALMLGATPQLATDPIVKHAFHSAILPTINSMVGMGIVFLPGMMTGQILAGASPLTAVQYQIAIMLGVTGSVALTVILFVQMGYKTFFNARVQLLRQDSES
ncbi:putative ABC transport system permease protein [Caldalkalibacillus uzonensis]|uniref:ABC transport system permease protein n=1 Tax=Caldalkalibacillus uzonensis TaxID=353224 RepID=A0ABU0CVP7_9BACI|nr:iron export ABC transporter permease subunit FetB [Caldalkalibacillus uzonensis]MDQ0340492.1 putative ABC transport system permease protein [Caldalkalibacillus uzonensis]